MLANVESQMRMELHAVHAIESDICAYVTLQDTEMPCMSSFHTVRDCGQSHMVDFSAHNIDKVGKERRSWMQA